jgi:hypothetical protein
LATPTRGRELDAFAQAALIRQALARLDIEQAMLHSRGAAGGLAQIFQLTAKRILHR